MTKQIVYQEDLDNLAEELTAKLERKFSWSSEISSQAFDLIWDELMEYFPNLKYAIKQDLYN